MRSGVIRSFHADGSTVHFEGRFNKHLERTGEWFTPDGSLRRKEMDWCRATHTGWCEVYIDKRCTWSGGLRNSKYLFGDKWIYQKSDLEATWVTQTTVKYGYVTCEKLSVDL